MYEFSNSRTSCPEILWSLGITVEILNPTWDDPEQPSLAGSAWTSAKCSQEVPFNFNDSVVMNRWSILKKDYSTKMFHKY